MAARHSTKQFGVVVSWELPPYVTYIGPPSHSPANRSLSVAYEHHVKRDPAYEPECCIQGAVLRMRRRQIVSSMYTVANFQPFRQQCLLLFRTFVTRSTAHAHSGTGEQQTTEVVQYASVFEACRPGSTGTPL